MILGPEDGTPSNSQIGLAPQNTISLSITGCQQLEVLSKTLNGIWVATLKPTLPNDAKLSFPAIPFTEFTGATSVSKNFIEEHV